MVREIVTIRPITRTSIVTSKSYGSNWEEIWAGVVAKRDDLVSLVQRHTSAYKAHLSLRRRGERPKKNIDYKALADSKMIIEID